MPSHSRRERDPTSTTTDNSTSSTTENTSSNSDLLSWLRGLFGGRDEETSTDVATDDVARESIEERLPGTSVEDQLATVNEEEELPATLSMAAEEVAVETRVNAETHAGDSDKVTLASGRMYTVTADDMTSSNPWKSIARNNGMAEDKLIPFNQHIVSVSAGLGPAVQHTETSEMKDGAQIYIPSAEELVFAQCKQKAGDFDAAVDLYGQLKLGPNIKVMTAARERASGKVGESYGTKGVDGGKFLTRNSKIAGASNRRSEMVNGHKEYAVFWLADFWKCSLFLHDVAFQSVGGGDLRSNNHYMVAGRLHQSKKYTEVAVDKARPGDAYQRFGGTGSDESHNAVLSSFVEKKDLGNNLEEWRYSIVGAESDRAAESEKTKTVKKGTNQTSDGKIVRFFRVGS